jgi:hypothetical protein
VVSDVAAVNVPPIAMATILDVEGGYPDDGDNWSDCELDESITPEDGSLIDSPLEDGPREFVHASLERSIELINQWRVWIPGDDVDAGFTCPDEQDAELETHDALGAGFQVQPNTT